MLINCPHCQSKGKITNSEKLSNTTRKVYVNCTNYEECNARFVVSIAHIYDVRLPDYEQLNSLEEQIARMEPERRKELLEKYHEPELEIQPSLF